MEVFIQGMYHLWQYYLLWFMFSIEYYHGVNELMWNESKNIVLLALKKVLKNTSETIYVLLFIYYFSTNPVHFPVYINC